MYMWWWNYLNKYINGRRKRSNISLTNLLRTLQYNELKEQTQLIKNESYGWIGLVIEGRVARR